MTNRLDPRSSLYALFARRQKFCEMELFAGGIQKPDQEDWSRGQDSLPLCQLIRIGAEKLKESQGLGVGFSGWDTKLITFGSANLL